MNIVNIQKAIAIMERAKARDSVYMPSWQVNPSCLIGRPLATVIKTEEEEFHTCGNKACFAGHIAISPEFQADGGFVRIDGSAEIAGGYDGGAISYWFGISEKCADHFVYGISDYAGSYIYPVPFEEVKAEHVIAALNQLLELGEEKCLEVWSH